jgi:hypothetical protein
VRPRTRLLAALLVLGASAHVAYWYWPRERAGAPELEEARALLADRSWAVVLWIPFPHQNLGVVERRVGDVDAWLARLATAAGTTPPRVPRFGPWSAPPSREMAIATRGDGAVRAVARVYPAVAALARLAGTLAGNPWLAGGEVAIAKDRRGTVAWRGRVWMLESSDAGGPSPPVAEAAGEPALARLRIERPPAPLPAGLWRVRREASGTLIAETGEPGDALGEGPAAAGVEPPAAWIAEREPNGAGPSALFLWTTGGAVEGFPRAAILDHGAARRFQLPGAGIARLAGLEPRTREEGGAVVQAFDGASLDEGVRLDAWLSGVLPPPPPAGPWRDLAAGADPGRAADALSGAARHLRRIPILGAREGSRLAAAADLLAPWGGCGELRLEVWRRPDAARAELCAAPREPRRR